MTRALWSLVPVRPVLVVLVIAVLALGAGLYHVRRDNEIKLALYSALTELERLNGLEEARATAGAGAALASSEIVLANVPPRDFAYQIIARPQFRTARPAGAR